MKYSSLFSVANSGLAFGVIVACSSSAVPAGLDEDALRRRDAGNANDGGQYDAAPGSDGSGGRADGPVLDGALADVTTSDGAIAPGSCAPGFAFRPVAAVAFRAWGMDADDVDGDGKPDLVFTSANPDRSRMTVNIALARGDGTFNPTASYTTGEGPISVVAADFNGDGKRDLAVAAKQGGVVSVLLNQGGGAFAAKVDYPSGDTPVAVIAVDVDGDAKSDLIVQNATGLGLLSGHGDGTFGAPTTLVAGGIVGFAPVDLNGDGKIDLACAMGAGGVGLALNQGGGSFAAPVAIATPSDAVAAADLDGDALPDFVVFSSSTGRVSVLKNQGGGSFNASIAYDFGPFSWPPPIDIKAADLTGDGKPEVLVTGPKNLVTVLHNRGDGTFDLPAQYENGISPIVSAARDWNGDGKPDLATTNAGSDDVTVLLNRGDGTFPPKWPRYATDNGVSALAAADFDGDGHPDLAAATLGSTGASRVDIFLAQGGGAFAPAGAFPTGQNSVDVLAADLNRDGKPDIVTANQGNATTLLGDLSVLLNTGNGTFASAVSLKAVGPGRVVAVDMNGDGAIDLAATNESTHDIGVHLNHGDGTFSAPVSYNAGGPSNVSPRRLAAADLDGDGKPELVATLENMALLGVLPNRGDGTFATAVAYTLPRNPTDVATGDFDGDGKPDVVVSYVGLYGTSLAGVMLNKGGTLVAPVAYDASVGYNLTPADLDGDGRLDLILNEYTDDTLVVLLNRGGGVFAPPARYTAGQGVLGVVAVDLNGDGRVEIATPDARSNTVSVMLDCTH